MRNSEQTKVIFRRLKKGQKEVIALFPEIHDSEDANETDVLSYMHVGQHGEANIALINRITRPATPSEYADLKRELESPPYEYKLKVVKRRVTRGQRSR